MCVQISVHAFRCPCNAFPGPHACWAHYALPYLMSISCRYEVFLDLSLPLTKEGKGGVLSFLSKNSTPSIEDCLQAFTTDEVMQVSS